MENISTEETQTNLEILFSKYQLLPVLREQFAQISDTYGIEADRPFISEMLSQIYLHRQADAPTMVGLLSPKFGSPQDVADKLLEMCNNDFIDFDTNQAKFIVKFDIADDIKAMLDKYQYPPPMVVQPKTVTSTLDTGYHTIHGSVILNGSKYFKHKDVCLDHLNRANSVALTIDHVVTASEEGEQLKPTRNPDESYQEFTKRQRQADVFYKTSVAVMESLSLLSDKLWLTHKYDRRGRCYPSGYHINPQGTDYNKAVLQFAEKELVDG